MLAQRNARNGTGNCGSLPCTIPSCCPVRIPVPTALLRKRSFHARIYTVSMEEKVCRYCIHKFRPSRYHPDQKVCSSGDCKRRRRTDYHRKKLVEDPDYREQCRDSQQKWREKIPHYMRRYWADRRAGDRLNAKKSRLTFRTEPALEIGREQLGYRSAVAGCKHLACLSRWVI